MGFPQIAQMIAENDQRKSAKSAREKINYEQK